MHLRTCGSLSPQIWVRKSQIRKVPHTRKVRQNNKLFKSANLRICYLRNLFVDRPPLSATLNILQKILMKRWILGCICRYI
jgi:hypothetical protein